MVDQVLVLAADDDGDVPGFKEHFAPAELCANGMAASHGQRVAVGVEKLAVKSPERVPDRDYEVDGARKLRTEDGGRSPGHDLEPDVRSDLRDALHQRRHQKLNGEIRHHQPKAPLAAGCIEIVGNEKS